jgi:hypothetical protein
VPSPNLQPLLSAGGVEILIKVISWLAQAVSGAEIREVMVEFGISMLLRALSVQPLELETIIVTGYKPEAL